MIPAQIANVVEPALWWREWRRISRWLISGRGLLLSFLALLFLAFILAPMLIVDFTDWPTLQRLAARPGWSFFLVAFALEAFAFVLAAVRSNQVLSQEFHSRMLDQFLLAFAPTDRVTWTLHAAGFAQAGLFSGLLIPILAICALGKESVSLTLFLGTLLVLAAFIFLAAGMGAVYFFVIHKLLPPPASSRRPLAAACALLLWSSLEQACHRANVPAEPSDLLARLLFCLALVVLWCVVCDGWNALGRRVSMGRGLAGAVLALGTMCAGVVVALTPLDVFVATRLKLLPLFLLPFPYTVGAAMPERWNELSTYYFGAATSVVALMAAVALFYVVAGFAAMEAVRRGYERLWRNPEPLYARGGKADEVVVSEANTYWRGLRNAVWTLEIRGRLRNRETATFMTFAAGVTALAGFLPAFSGLEVLSDPLRAAEVARGVFGYLVLTEVTLVTFLVPGFTSEAISAERDHRTLELVLATALSPFEILAGKLLGATSYMMLLVSPSLPLFAFCCVFHGATATQVLLAYALMATAAAVWGTLGVTLSATMHDLVSAKYTTYALVLMTGAIPGSPLYLAFYIANPNEVLMGLRLAEIIPLAVMWLVVGNGILLAQWANACFQLGPRYGATR